MRCDSYIELALIVSVVHIFGTWLGSIPKGADGLLVDVFYLFSYILDVCLCSFSFDTIDILKRCGTLLFQRR